MLHPKAAELRRFEVITGAGRRRRWPLEVNGEPWVSGPYSSLEFADVFADDRVACYKLDGSALDAPIGQHDPARG